MTCCFFTCCKRKNSSSSSKVEKSKTPSIPTATATVNVEITEEERRRGGPAVVELFTSQGCATSPEAESILSRIGRGDFNLEIPVILLAYHVDYWDYMGWKDPFGSNQWTVRQKEYIETLQLDSMFTPQVVVQGQTQCVGNEEESVLSLIMSAQRVLGPALQASFKRPNPNTLQVTFDGPLRTKIDTQGIDVIVVLYENGLVTDCQKGENNGRVLANDYVVRRLENLCHVKDVNPKKMISGTVSFTLWDGFNSSKCGVAVFLQNSTRQIFGSQNFKLPNDL